jgi:hypothetical protein
MNNAIIAKSPEKGNSGFFPAVDRFAEILYNKIS